MTYQVEVFNGIPKETDDPIDTQEASGEDDVQEQVKAMLNKHSLSSPDARVTEIPPGRNQAHRNQGTWIHLWLRMQ